MYEIVVNDAEVPVKPGFSEALERLLNLPGRNESNSAPSASLNFSEFLPESKDFWHYRGSLTSSGCTENVTWYLMQEPAHLTWGNYVKLRDAVSSPELGNTVVRPPYPLYQRTVLASNYAVQDDDHRHNGGGALCEIPARVAPESGSKSGPFSAVSRLSAINLLALVVALAASVSFSRLVVKKVREWSFYAPMGSRHHVS
jgi:hypothetical protein